MPNPVLLEFDKNKTNITALAPTIVTDGWVFQEIPTSGNMNSLMSSAFANLNFLKSNGVYEYEAGVTYQKNARATEGGVEYVSLVAGNTGSTPSSSPSKWGIAVEIAGRKWRVGANYMEGDMVSFDSVVIAGVHFSDIWICDVDNTTGVAPSATASEWRKADYVRKIYSNMNISVGAGGTFQTLVECLDFVSSFLFVGGSVCEITILAGHAIDYLVQFAGSSFQGVEILSQDPSVDVDITAISRTEVAMINFSDCFVPTIKFGMNCIGVNNGAMRFFIRLSGTGTSIRLASPSSGISISNTGTRLEAAVMCFGSSMDVSSPTTGALGVRFIVAGAGAGVDKFFHINGGLLTAWQAFGNGNLKSDYNIYLQSMAKCSAGGLVFSGSLKNDLYVSQGSIAYLTGSTMNCNIAFNAIVAQGIAFK